ncbi:hypothetical protein BT69DRAFT_1283414 [Atractiella rhizophila]|nr:hypothetical protein BT69DRAFT_1283414 [Atractiella rhizophila]
MDERSTKTIPIHCRQTSQILSLIALGLSSSMEASTDPSKWTIVTKSEGGYIIEMNGVEYLLPAEMMLTVLAGLLARAI